MAGCKLPGYVGRDVSLEIAYACGDVDVNTLTWTAFGSLRTKSFELTWDTADASSDSSINSLRENLATFQNFTISGDGVAKRAVEAGEVSTFTQLTKHVARPGPDYSNQPVAWLRITFPDLTFIAYMLITTLSRNATYDDVVTFDFEASVASSDVGLLVQDTPDPDAPAPTSVTTTPATATIAVGGTQQLASVVAPNNATQTVSYSSSAPGVATVSTTGLVTGVTEGTATITARSTVNNAINDTVAITVDDTP